MYSHLSFKLVFQRELTKYCFTWITACDQWKYFSSNSSLLSSGHRDMLKFCTLNYLKPVTGTVCNILGKRFYASNNDKNQIKSFHKQIQQPWRLSLRRYLSISNYYCKDLLLRCFAGFWINPKFERHFWIHQLYLRKRSSYWFCWKLLFLSIY